MVVISINKHKKRRVKKRAKTKAVHVFGIILVVASINLLCHSNYNPLSEQFTGLLMESATSTRENDEDVFPPGCSWRCYGKNNPHVVGDIGWDKRAVINEYQQRGKLEGRKCGCEIVLLAGPHKAASTTLQTIANVYSGLEDIPWNWIVPSSFKEGGWQWGEEKAFAPFVFSYYNQVKKHSGKDLSFDELKLSYKREIDKQYYRESNNIILGSEEIDQITDPQKNKGNLAHEILSLLPEPAIENSHVTVLVVYRAPRIDHLKSLWKEVVHAIEQKTFYEFLKSPHFRFFFKNIDATQLALKLLEEGFPKVQILDMSGIDFSKGSDYFAILGCDIMGLSCESKDGKMMPRAIAEHSESDRLLEFMSKPRNVKDDENYSFNMTDTQLREIEELLKRYDCMANKKLYGNDKVQILYGNKLTENMKECLSLDESELLTRDELFTKIEQLLH